MGGVHLSYGDSLAGTGTDPGEMSGPKSAQTKVPTLRPWEPQGHRALSKTEFLEDKLLFPPQAKKTQLKVYCTEQPRAL